MIRSFIPCVTDSLCMSAETASWKFFLSDIYELITGNNLLLLAQVLVFAIIGLLIKKKVLLVYGLLIFWLIMIISFVVNYNYVDALIAYLTTGQYILHFLIYFYLKGLLFILIAVAFSVYAQGLEVLSSPRKAIEQSSIYYKIGLLISANLIVIFILGRII